MFSYFSTIAGFVVRNYFMSLTFQNYLVTTNFPNLFSIKIPFSSYIIWYFMMWGKLTGVTNRSLNVKMQNDSKAVEAYVSLTLQNWEGETSG